MKNKIYLLALALLFTTFSCNQTKVSSADLFKAMEEKPVLFMETLTKVAQKAEEEKLFKNRFKPFIAPNEAIRGTANAPIVIVEYSDFQCPFCKRAYGVVKQLLQKYNGKIQFIYKNFPLSRLHPVAILSGKYYEALKIQNKEIAFKFHDELFENQDKINKGEGYLKAVAKKLGADMKKLEADVKSEAIEKKLQMDMSEVNKFGFQGAPGFLVNGIPVRGARGLDHFDGIISKLQKRGIIKL